MKKITIFILLGLLNCDFAFSGKKEEAARREEEARRGEVGSRIEEDILKAREEYARRAAPRAEEARRVEEDILKARVETARREKFRAGQSDVVSEDEGLRRKEEGRAAPRGAVGSRVEEDILKARVEAARREKFRAGQSDVVSEDEGLRRKEEARREEWRGEEEASREVIRVAFKEAIREEIIEARVAAAKEEYIEKNLKTFGEFKKLLNKCREARKNALQIAKPEEDPQQLEEMSKARVEVLKVALIEWETNNSSINSFFQQILSDRKKKFRGELDEALATVHLAKENIKKRVEETKAAILAASREEIIEASLAAAKEEYIEKKLKTFGEFENPLNKCGLARIKTLRIANREEDLNRLEEMSRARVKVLKVAIAEGPDGFGALFEGLSKDLWTAFCDAVNEGARLADPVEIKIKKREKEIVAAFRDASREEIIEAKVEAVKECYIKIEPNASGEFEEILKKCREDRKKALQSANREEDPKQLEEMSKARVEVLKVALIEWETNNSSINSFFQQILSEREEEFQRALDEALATVHLANPNIKKREEEIAAAFREASREEIIEAKVEAAKEEYIEKKLHTFGEFEEILNKCREARIEALKSANREEDPKQLEEMSRARVEVLKARFTAYKKNKSSVNRFFQHLLSDRKKKFQEASCEAEDISKRLKSNIKKHTEAVILAASTEEIIEASLAAAKEKYIEKKLNTFGEFEEILNKCREARIEALKSANREEDPKQLEESSARVEVLKAEIATAPDSLDVYFKELPKDCVKKIETAREKAWDIAYAVKENIKKRVEVPREQSEEK